MKAVMPFGKYRGKPLDEVPKGYLAWLDDNVTLYGWLKSAVNALLAGERLPDDEDEGRVRRVIKPWSPDDGRLL